jgi:uncharacterized membrane protein YhaH (DUF805 family)
VELWHTIFDPRGRIARRGFLAYIVVSAALCILLDISGQVISNNANGGIEMIVGNLLFYIGAGASWWSLFALVAKRLRDMGLSSVNIVWILPTMMLMLLPFPKGDHRVVIVFCMVIDLLIWLIASPTEAKKIIRLQTKPRAEAKQSSARKAA